jgi:hypothetical protein
MSEKAATSSTDVKKPFFNRKKFSVFPFSIFTIVFIGAGFYGLYCYFTDAAFLNFATNLLLKWSVHSNVLANILTPVVSGITEILGVLCLASLIARSVAWHKKEFEFVLKRFPTYDPKYYLPTMIGVPLYDLKFTDRWRAWLCGMKTGEDKDLYTLVQVGEEYKDIHLYWQ